MTTEDRLDAERYRALRDTYCLQGTPQLTMAGEDMLYSLAKVYTPAAFDKVLDDYQNQVQPSAIWTPPESGGLTAETK